MNALWGTVVNALAVIGGCLLGLVLPRMPERIKGVIMQGLGLAIFFLGAATGIKTGNFLLVIISLTVGGLIGALLSLDAKLQRAGEHLESAVKKFASAQHSAVADGFVAATLLFCVGAMAILGSIESGLYGNHTILYTKSMLDGISAMLLTTTLGYGVMFSAGAVFLYQGAIALCAKYITSFLHADKLEVIVNEVSAVGGILIAGIGLTMLNIVKINVVNLLPAIFVIAALYLYF